MKYIKYIVVLLFVAILFFVRNSTVSAQQTCYTWETGDWALCEINPVTGQPVNCQYTGGGGSQEAYDCCVSAGTSTCEAPTGTGGGGVERTCYPRRDCPLNSTCVPSGIYSCNTVNANYSSYVDYFIGDVPSGYSVTCSMGNAEELIQICDDGACWWYDRKYACCPAGQVSMYYYTQPADYTKNVNPCEGGQPYNCYPDTFVSFTPTWQCGITARDENGERFPIYAGITTCRPQQVKVSFCQQICSATAPSTPQLLSPSNGASVSPGSISLVWNNTSQTWGSACVTQNNQFSVYIGTSPLALGLLGTVGSGTGSANFSGTEGQTYYWKVRDCFVIRF